MLSSNIYLSYIGCIDAKTATAASKASKNYMYTKIHATSFGLYVWTIRTLNQVGLLLMWTIFKAIRAEAYQGTKETVP